MTRFYDAHDSEIEHTTFEDEVADRKGYKSRRRLRIFVSVFVVLILAAGSLAVLMHQNIIPNFFRKTSSLPLTRITQQTTTKTNSTIPAVNITLPATLDSLSTSTRTTSASATSPITEKTFSVNITKQTQTEPTQREISVDVILPTATTPPAVTAPPATEPPATASPEVVSPVTEPPTTASLETAPPETQPPAGKEPIVISASISTSGYMADYGRLMKMGITLAVEEINAHGGLLDGRSVELKIAEDDSTASTAVANISSLIDQNNVSVHLGPHFSDLAIASKDLFNAYGIPFVTGAISSDLNGSTDPNFFRISVSNATFSRGLATFAHENLGATRIGLIYDQSDYGTQLQQSAVDLMMTQGIDYYTVGCTSDPASITSAMNEITAYAPTALIAYTAEETTLHLLNAYRSSGLNCPLIGPTILMSHYTVDCPASTLAGVYVGNDLDPEDRSRPEMATFIDAFSAHYGEKPGYYGMLYYSAVRLIANAIEQAGSTEPAAIREALAQITNVQTPIGVFNCSPNHDMLGRVSIYQFDTDKQIHFVTDVYPE